MGAKNREKHQQQRFVHVTGYLREQDLDAFLFSATGCPKSAFSRTVTNSA